MAARSHGPRTVDQVPAGSNGLAALPAAVTGGGVGTHPVRASTGPFFFFFLTYKKPQGFSPGMRLPEDEVNTDESGTEMERVDTVKLLDPAVQRNLQPWVFFSLLFDF